MLKLYGDRRERFTFILLLLYAAAVFMFDADESGVKLIYLAFGMLALNFVRRTRSIRFYKETVYMFLYALFGLLSIVWSEDGSLSFTRAKALFILLTFLVLATTYAVKIKNPVIFVAAIAVGAIALSAYMFYLYGFSGIMSALSQSKNNRLGWDINNVNAIGNSLSTGVIALVGLALFYNKKILLILLAPIGICLLATGSRTALLSMIAGLLILTYFYLRSSKNAASWLLKLIVIVAVILAVWAVIRNVPATRTIILRFESSISIANGGPSLYKETSTQTRMDYIELGWKEFLSSPVYGNGLGCAGHIIKEEYGRTAYLHNNYVEILASGGIIGFFLFYMPYMSALGKFGKRIFFSNDKDPVIFISFALLITKLVGHFGTVMYYSKIEFLLLALWISAANMKVDAYEQG